MADNTSAISWIIKSSQTNDAGRALSRILCSLQIDSPLGLNGDFLAGSNNIVVGCISRLSPNSFSSDELSNIFKEFSRLNSCQRFHPSQELVSSLLHALLLEPLSVLPPLKTLGHTTANKNII